MNCVQCNAQLVPRSTQCFFCGTRQPTTATQSGSPVPSMGASTAWSGSHPRSEGWRIWLSTFLGGMYAPIAGLFLLRSEEWTAGLSSKGIAPSRPGSQGGVVIMHFMLVPAIAAFVFGLSVHANAVGNHAPINILSHSIRWTRAFLLANVFVASIPALGLIIARHLRRRFEALLYEQTSGDPKSIAHYRTHRWVRTLAACVALVPMAFVLVASTVLRVQLWSSIVPMLAGLYILAYPCAAFASGWLCIEPTVRYRSLMHRLP